MADLIRFRAVLTALVVSACAQGTQSDEGGTQSLAEAGSAGADVAGGSGRAGGASPSSSGSPATNAGSAGRSGSGTGGTSTNGGASASAGGAHAGAGGTGAGGTSAGGTSAGGSSAGGSSAGSGSGGAPAAPCSGKKPESDCTCQSYSAHDYWFCPTARDFNAAEAKCVTAGLHLVKVTSAAEDKWLNDAVTAASFGEYFLGSTDASTPNTWTWLAGGTFWTGLANGTGSGYSHWNTGEPNASGDCVVVQTGFVWDDRACSDNRKYICD